MMKIYKSGFKLSVFGFAALTILSTTAYADQEEINALTKPTSYVEVEGIYVSTASQKFGEYNGLNNQGGYVNGNLNIKGGGSYKENEQGNTSRWSVTGTNLGLSDRSATASASDQGTWSVGVGYDELTHNTTTNYQTPYIGSMGGNTFNLPSSWGANKTASGTNGNYESKTLSPANLGAFNNVNVSNTRKNSSFNAVAIVDPSLNFTVDYNHLDQSGAKLMGFGASSWNTGGKVTGESTAILPNPTNYQTDTVTVAANWQGEKSRLTASYFGSFFRDGFNGVSWSPWETPANATVANATAGNGMTQTMSTAPSNQFQQLNLNGGHDFSSTTKLTGGFSWGRNTQNSSPAVDGYSMQNNFSIPAFNGLVNVAHADLKLVDKSFKDLNLSAAYKFNERDNLSQSSIQRFVAIGSQAGFVPNTPLSLRTSLLELSGEYRLTKDQRLALTYGNGSTARWCNQYADGAAALGTTQANSNTATNGRTVYPAGADCVTANFTRTNNLAGLYKIKASDSVNIKLGYAYDVRQTTWNQNAIASVGTTIGSTSQPYASAFVPPGTNGGDYYGYKPFFEASRNQQIAKASGNWQATDAVTLNLGAKYISSIYPNSTYGMQNSNAIALNLDGTYEYAEQGTASAYVVQQNGQRLYTNLQSYTTGSYSNTLQEHDTTFGIGFKQAGLLSGGKLSLSSDLTYSLGQSFYNTWLNYAGVPQCATQNIGSSSAANCGQPPAIRNAMLGFKFGSAYQIDKHSKVGIQYLYQRLVSTDPYYNGLQTGNTPTTVLPTNQQPGSYAVNVVSLGYTYSFD